MSLRGFPLLVIGLTVLALNAGARAALINLDINDVVTPVENYTGAAAIGSAGDQWNYFTPTNPSTDTIANLNDSNGAATLVTFNISGSGMGTFNRYGTSNALLDDYLYIFGNTATLTISNLMGFGSYDLYIYSTAGTSPFLDNFTFSSTNKIANGGWSGSYVEGDNYVHFSGLAADGSGTITGTMNTIGVFNFAVFNGFQIQGQLPEPASASLLALAVIPMLRRHRR